jgi:hypothetical protein
MVEDVLDPAELVERDLDLLGRLAVEVPEHLQVAARDRDSRWSGTRAGGKTRSVSSSARRPSARHSEQLAPELLAAERVAQDQAPGRHDHEPELSVYGRPELGNL